MEQVTFKVLKVEDIRKFGSEVVEGAFLVGHRHKDKVYYTDCRNTDWIFYVNDTCEILNQ